MPRPVLLIEDNPDDVLWARRALGLARIQNPIDVAVTGEDAIRYLTNSGESDPARSDPQPSPVLVLLDLVLPVISGLEVLTWIKMQRRLASLPVIVLTGSDDLNLLARARELGAFSFLLKPLDPKQLVTRLSGRTNLLGKSTGARSRQIVSVSHCKPALLVALQ